MRTSGGSVGPIGATLLLVTAVAGALLGVHGWSDRHSGPPAGALGAVSSPASGAASGSPGPTNPTNPTSPTSPTSPSTGRSPAAGPLLASQSFASYSFQVWPGTPSAAAKGAMTGLSISVRRTGSGISVTAGVSGHPGTPHAYSGGARVYVVEASMGDEAGNSDYNLGDDGVVVTDAQGRILQ
ncbi:MAG: hypothetical protein WB797_11205 [Nocardioides sp.]